MYHYISVLKYHFNLQTETKFDFRLVWQKLEKQLTALSWLYKKRKQGKTTNIRLSQTRLCTTHQNLPPTQIAQLWNRVPGPGFLFLFSILVVIQKRQNWWWHRVGTPHLSKFPPKQQCTHNLILKWTTSQIRSSSTTPTPLFETRTDPLQHFKTTLFEIVATILQIYTVVLCSMPFNRGETKGFFQLRGRTPLGRLQNQSMIEFYTVFVFVFVFLYAYLYICSYVYLLTQFKSNSVKGSPPLAVRNQPLIEPAAI